MTVNAMSLCLLGCFKKNLKRQQDSLISEGCNALDSFESQLENNNKHLSTHDRALPKIPDNRKTNCCTKDEDDEEEENDSLYDIISKSRKKQNVNYKSDYKLKNSGRSKKNKLGAKKGFNDCEDVKNAEEIENTSQIQETSNCESIIKHDTNDKIKNDHRKLSPEPHSTKNNDATNNPITTKAGNDTNNFPSQSTSPSLSLLPSGPFQYTINNHHHHFYHHQPGRLSKINNTNNDNNNINDTLACVNTTNISNIGDDFISNNVHTDNLNQITSNNVLQMYPANNEIYAYPQLNNVSNRNSRRFQNYNTNETNILQTDQNIYRPPYNNTTSQIQSNTHTSTTQNIQPFDHRPISSFPDYSSVTARESLENLRKRERELAGTKCIKRGSNSGVRNVNMRAIEEGGEETYDTINYDLIKQASRKAPDHLYSTTGSDLYAEIETGQSSSRSSMYARVSDVLPPTPVSPSQTLFEGAITPQNSTHPLQSTSSQAWQLQCRPSYHEEGLQKRLPLSINNPSFTPNRVASFMEFSAGNSTSESKNNDGRSHFWTSILGTAVFKDNDNSAIFNNKFQKRSSSTRNEINTVDNFNSNRRNSNTNDLTDIVENLKNRRLYHHYSIPHLNMPIYSKVNKDKSKPSRENDYDVVNDDQDAKGGTDDDSTMQNNRNNNKNNNNNNNINNDKNIDKNNSPVCTPKYNFDSGYARIADIPDNINYSNNIKNNKINNNKNNDNNNNKENDKDNRFSVSSLYESVAESYEYIPNNNENNSHHNTNNNSNNKNNNRNLTVYLNKKEDYVIKPYHTVKIRSFEDKKNVKIIPSVFINNNNNNKFNNNDKTNTPNKINRLILRNHNEKRLKIADVGRNGKHPTDRDRHNNNNDEDINRISLGRSCFYVDNNDQLTNNSTDKSIDSNNSLLNPTKSAAKFTQTSKPSKSPLQSKSTFFIASNRITSSLEQPLPPQPPASMISTQSTLPQPQLKQNHLYHHRVCYPSNKFTVLPLPSSSTSPSSPPSSLSSSSSSSSAHQVLSLNPQRFKKFHIYDEVKDSPINSTNATKNNNNNNNITKQNNNNNNLKTLSEMPNDIDHNDPETDV